MKNLILILVLFSSIQFSNAQEFETTDAYQISINPIVNDKEQTLFNASVIVANQPEVVVTNFKIMSTDNVRSISIQTLIHPNLVDVEEIIKMELTYGEPQAYTISKYVLVKKDQSYIDLPAIVNMSENAQKSDVLYVFPNQAFGEANKIVKLEINFSDAALIENVEVLKAFAWNDTLDTSHKMGAPY
ncbi:MAG: hypothetical protein ACSHXF_01905 [Aquaticitalea sp.]